MVSLGPSPHANGWGPVLALAWCKGEAEALIDGCQRWRQPKKGEKWNTMVEIGDEEEFFFFSEFFDEIDGYQ